MIRSEVEPTVQTETDMLVDVQDQAMRFRLSIAEPKLWERLFWSQRNVATSEEMGEGFKTLLVGLLIRKGLLITEASELAHYTLRELYYHREGDKAEREAKRNNTSISSARTAVLEQRKQEYIQADKAIDGYKVIISREYDVPEPIAREWLYRPRVAAISLGNALYACDRPTADAVSTLNEAVEKIRETRRHHNLENVEMSRVWAIAETEAALPYSA